MLRLKEISKFFPQNAKPALDNINLHIKAGEYCVILGSNGSGKSTLLKVISGEYKEDSGEIFLDNQHITNKAMNQRSKMIASVSQDINKGTVGDLTLMENLALSKMRTREATFAFYHSSKNKLTQQIKDLGLGLENSINTKMSDLSGGQRQAIATLMAVTSESNLLLLDEHTSALDPRSHNKIMNFTDKNINQRRLTTLMITHNIKDALTYGNRLIIMSHGRIINDFTQKEKLSLDENKILELLHEAGELI
ncbi:MAG: hypothetical protein DGJ47_000168 [Rickettsiaceae bacterium]